MHETVKKHEILRGMGSCLSLVALCFSLATGLAVSAALAGDAASVANVRGMQREKSHIVDIGYRGGRSVRPVQGLTN